MSSTSTPEKRHGPTVACPKEIASRIGMIGKEALVVAARALQKSGYGRYLRRLLNGAP